MSMFGSMRGSAYLVWCPDRGATREDARRIVALAPYLGGKSVHVVEIERQHRPPGGERDRVPAPGAGRPLDRQQHPRRRREQVDQRAQRRQLLDVVDEAIAGRPLDRDPLDRRLGHVVAGEVRHQPRRRRQRRRRADVVVGLPHQPRRDQPMAAGELQRQLARDLGRDRRDLGEGRVRRPTSSCRRSPGSRPRRASAASRRRRPPR